MKYTPLLGTINAQRFLSYCSKPSDIFQLGPLKRTLIDFMCLEAVITRDHLRNEYSDLMSIWNLEMDRSVVHSDREFLYNYAKDTLVDHGFDVMEFRS